MMKVEWRATWHAQRARWHGLWLRVGPPRALAEVLLAQAPLLVWVLFFQADASPSAQIRVVAALIVPLGPGAILWCVWRIRRIGWPWPARLALYTVMGALIAVTPTLLLTIFWQTQEHTLLRPRFPLNWFFGLWLAAFTAAFVVSRLGVRLLIFWNGLRRRRLVFALTHAHLLVVVFGMCVFAGLLVLNEVYFTHRIQLQLLPILFVLFVVTVILLLVVLPPSALFSYLFARRTTRRLQSLALATDQLRAGDYDSQVTVRGEDEVAQLQENFNAMAHDLQQAMRDVEAERDRVAGLLAARRQLVASVSHELRTPVATLRGYLESARTHWDTTSPETLRADLAVMERETVHLQTLIDDLFTLARAEVGKLELRHEPVDILKVARNCVESIAPLAWQRARVEVVCEPAATALPRALADAGRLEQVLQNLLHNALRHTPPGGIVAVSVTAEEVSAERKHRAVVLRVRDTGAGIPEDELSHIWERFYRTARSRAEADGGTGLGLALVKELVAGMGGSVAVESTLGVGSCFSVRLPAVTRDANASVSPASQSATDEERQHPLMAGGAARSAR
ncbi:MAG TPA: HAMP domain-containing sensor histidine kinase [Ktedonobacterales bacterium]|nr:HAMP domain-containing sensor histidine kinase [Ktedonobacterales bacterium]